MLPCDVHSKPSPFQDLLTKHKPLVAEFLEANYNPFIEKYTGLLNSDNYVTKRQSLKVWFPTDDAPPFLKNLARSFIVAG